MCVHASLLKTGVDAGDRVELRDAALGRGVKALGLAAHLEEDFLFLQLSGKLFLQSLQGEDTSVSVSIAIAVAAKMGHLSAQRQCADSPTELINDESSLLLMLLLLLLWTSLQLSHGWQSLYIINRDVLILIPPFSNCTDKPL